jgi:glycerol-3-phosphate dehydrogenase
MLQWEWLGGLAPIRRIAVIGAGAWGTALATVLSRAGFEVELGTRTREQAEALAQTRVNERHLPGVRLPDELRVMRASQLNLEGHDLVCLAVPPTALPAVLAAHGPQISRRIGLLVTTRGLVPPLGTLPAAFAAERSSARAVAVLSGPVRAAAVVQHGGSVVVAAPDRGFARQLSEMLASAKLDVTRTRDLIGLQLAGCAVDAAAVAAAAARDAGPDIAGAAAGKVFAEIEALARAGGSGPETFAGLVGAGELVTTVVGDGASGRREGVETLPLLADVARRAHVPTPELDRLVALVQGRIEPEQWQAAVSEPGTDKRRPARAA